MQIQKNHIQDHPFPPEMVFPLLCPVREKDWLQGWDYNLIHSDSGLVERDCVFTTPHHSDADTVWIVDHHDPKKMEVGFVLIVTQILINYLEIYKVDTHREVFHQGQVGQHQILDGEVHRHLMAGQIIL